MTLAQRIDRLRIRLNDPQKIEFSDAELEGYVLDALQAVHAMRIQAKDPKIVVSATVSTTLPANWAGWVGQVPLKVSGNSVSGGPATVRYFRTAPLPPSGSSPLDVPDCLLPSVLNYAVLQGRIRLGLDIDQEGPLTQKILQGAAAALGLSYPKGGQYGAAR